MGPGLTLMAMCSCMLTRCGRPRLPAALPAAMGAWTRGRGLREAPTDWGQGGGSGPRSQGEEASLRAQRGISGGGQDLRTECRVRVGGMGENGGAPG